MKRLCATIVIALISIHSFAQAPNWQWAKSAGGTNNDQGNSIAVDAAGNTYITGFFKGPTITFGATTVSNNYNGSQDIFITKYDANGNALWAKSAGGFDNEYVSGIAVDASGNTYITGSFYGPTTTFGTTTLTNNGNCNIFVTKYDSNGNVIWAKSAGGTSYDNAHSIAVDAAGNAIITGYFGSSTITFGTTTLTNNGGGDILIAKYDTNGNVVWAKSAGGTGSDTGSSIALDAAGTATITGYYFSDTITFGATTLISNSNIGGGDNIFIAKYDTNGNVIWAKSAGGTYYDNASSIAVDAAGNATITGSLASPTVTFGTTTLTNNGIGTSDIFIAKYDTNGNALWAKSAGGTDEDLGSGVAIDATGNTYITGRFQSPAITFGTTTLSKNGSNISTDIFIAKYDTNGNVVWAKSVGGTSYDDSYSIAIDAVGNAYITGYFKSPTITFGATTLTNAISTGSTTDFFIAKLDGTITTGIAEMENGETVLLAPNPFTSQLSISFNEAQKNTSIKLMNTLGECIQQLTTSNQQLILDMSSFARGMYFVQITDANKNVVNKKVIKE
ncbi:MAG: T9SS type A sorting domain-containing protein [Bacteroidota bacterium]